MNFPIVCNLTAEQLRERRETVLSSIRKSAIAVKELPVGYEYAFQPDSVTLEGLAQLVDLERQCCQFLTFKIVVEPPGSLKLEVTGPPDAKFVIADLLGS